VWKPHVIECNIDYRVKCFLTLAPIVQNYSLALLMENVEDSCNDKKKEVKVKRARGMSLRACVAKAAGWTLEKANSSTSQEANINKVQ
jgi:hypothetical protein